MSSPREELNRILPMIEAAVKVERERCATVLDALAEQAHPGQVRGAYMAGAAAIRKEPT